MAATDQTHRNQRMLDVVFGASCLLMLVSLVWMFYDDQYRDWKKEQRQFRNVAEAMAQRSVINLAPSREDLAKIDDAQESVVWAREVVDRKKALVHGQLGRIRESKKYFQEALDKLQAAEEKAKANKNAEAGQAAVERLQPKIAYVKEQIEQSEADLKTAEGQKSSVDSILADKAKADTTYQNIKADLDSITSFYNDAIDKRNRSLTDTDHLIGLQLNVNTLKKKVDELTVQLGDAQNKVDAINARLSVAMMPVTVAEADLSKKEDRLKDLTADFDRFHKLAEQKKWGAGDWFRALPVIDAFASPIKIQQYTLDELTIDYSFKRVTRYDRCTTCHLGIDQPTYTKEALAALREEPSQELQSKAKAARYALRQRQKITGNASFDPDSVQLSRVDITDEQINEFCAHPRLDLFVSGNSPHPSEKFGCTICHAGQGSSTSFLKATHTPNNSAQLKEWTEKKDWEHDHNWDYPMLPSRFIESACIKCHHQITDLVREGSKEEAPKLLKGYNLVRENGCFGCHEIAGIKGGRSIGPDLRLEPTPPLDDYTPAEKAKLTADTFNPPGQMRKVGPSLRRLSEKTNAEWLRRWIKEPRNFRPDTKMPHFYGLANNRPDLLPAEQAQFPDQEINAITHYLLTESDEYLKGSDMFRKALQAELDELKKKQLRSEKEDLRIAEITRRLELQKKPDPLFAKAADGKESLHIVTAEGKVITELPKEAPDETNGRKLFTERGCLACHMHEATTKAQGAKGKPGYLPGLETDAHFGPNLTRLAAKLGNGKKDSARAWLVQWILNPKLYHPRTFMPQVHLDLTAGNDVKAANDIAGWLLAQKADWSNPPPVAAPDLEVLKKLAAVSLNRAYSPSQVKEILGKDNGFSVVRIDAMAPDREERELSAPLDDKKLMRYIGRKAINQYGCFGCHDIPGYEYAKPIGTPLNDWGKKDPERLAFEDAAAYVRKNHHIAPLRDNPSDAKKADPEWKSAVVKEKVKRDGKEVEDTRVLTPYEKYFYDALDHHQREGFLHQKLAEPRSYDYARLHVWDDRLRMPQFNFSRKTPGPKATPDEKAAIAREEAEAREAVMTFILGLVAEPVPTKYTANPSPERLAEAQGRKVLDKFNCAGCHLVRPGVYEFKTAGIIDKLSQTVTDYNASPGGMTNHVFPDHNAWSGPTPTRPDRLTLFGVNARPTINEDNGDKEISFRLTHAVRFPMKNKDGKTEMADLPAGSTPPGWALPRSALVESAPQFGGTFANALTGYLVQSDKTLYPPDDPDNTPLESQKARPKVPPALLREGEKTQPLWLYQFLRDPTPIRPTVVLRMPKFNMSEEDAKALVTYFSAADKMANPGMGLNYPYYSVKEREEVYLDDSTKRYLARLEKDKALDARLKSLIPVWDIQVKDRIIELQAKEKAAENAIKELMDKEEKEKDPALKAGAVEQRKAIEKDLAGIKEELKTMNEEAKDNKFPQLSGQWKQSGAYLNDSFRLATSKDTCVKCHQVGGILMGEAQGPPLHLAEQRLRPEWVQRWVALPERFSTYPSPMPPYFARLNKKDPNDKPKYQEYFVGDPDDQVKAMRDFLMNYRKAVDMPVNRNRPVVATGGK